MEHENALSEINYMYMCCELVRRMTLDVSILVISETV